MSVTPAVAPTYTVFRGMRRIAVGSLADAAIAFQQASLIDAHLPVLIFDDLTGDTRDVDVRGTAADIRERYRPVAAPVVTSGAALAQPISEAIETLEAPEAPAKSRGRPKLGVVAREVTLLPRHWDWLAEQPGGASVVLRKLVEEARRKFASRDLMRRAQERAYRFMSTMAGDLPEFEEASRALFANDFDALGKRIAGWPDDVREYLLRLTSTDDLAERTTE
ncbi:hypothetical protein PIN31115_04018 [Pandoraea iniqua]|uniref:DUF2239 domain-containing protein n=1 Tax=Pandoraea iniqua TaxID=2508288 RepID=A0A5E4XQL3_9BURK|nr:DUF2239 family protein [Pandoraea iniqua]VVE38689.1 hypothetical protein PIN31115_04018 [Pandoraea iniqua]